MNTVRKNKKGFTLMELLAVIVLLAVFLLIAVPTVSNQIEKSKKKAFFTSVSNIVNAIKPDKIINEKDFCIYNYQEDVENQVENIKSLAVLAHKDSETQKVVYSVYASMDGKEDTINIYDFNKLKIDNMEEWVAEQTTPESYTYYASSLFVDQNKQEELFSYTVCDID